ncbi:MAG TPA: TIR domain-containing protein, partial [Actinomycetota bacterium]
MKQRGLNVWFDEMELQLGDSLRQRIDEGIRLSQYGVVVLSPNFFAKNWPKWELDGLAERELSGGKVVVLPVWHNILHDEVAAYSPTLANKVAAKTSEGIHRVAVPSSLESPPTALESGKSSTLGPTLPQFNSFTVPTAGSQPAGIAVGGDGNLWFTELIGNKIGRMTPSGVVKEFPLPTANSQPTAITSGSDGNLWFVERLGGKIGRITTAGLITEFPVSNAEGIVRGRDGNLWFTVSAGIGKITPEGNHSVFPLANGSQP